MASTSTTNGQCLVVKNNLVRHATLIFTGLCLAATAILAITQPLPYAENETLMRIWIGYLGLPLALGLIGFNVWKLVSRKWAIRIDDQGITDYSTALSSGFTAWDDIKEVFLLRLKNDDYLCAVPLDYESWLQSRTARARKLAEANVESGFTPIRIQFKKVSNTITSREGVAFCKKIQPKKVTRIRKPKY